MDFKIKDEKEFMTSLFEKNGRHYKNGNEDDYILRYFTYRGFFERTLSKQEGFEFLNDIEGKGGAKEWIELFSRIPKKYQKVIDDADIAINNKTLNIEEFKETIFENLDDDQKDWLNKYGKLSMGMTMSGLKELYLIDYIIQIEYEFLTISYLNFSGYFNITFDYILYAKLNHIAVGPGRGSAAGCIISYLTYITDVDALKYELLFERMLHILKAKDDVPDIDVDFETSKRYDIIEYVKNKFGEKNVCHVGNYLTTKIKGVFKDLTRKTGIDFSDINKITKALGAKDDEIKENFEKMIQFYDGADVDLDDGVTSLLIKHKKTLVPFFKITKEQCGFPKLPGIHACGVIISPVPIETICGCRFHQTTKAKIGLFYKTEMEMSGLLKFDFLGLQNMETIKTTIKSVIWNNKDVQEKYGIDLKNKEGEDWDNLDWYKMYYDIIDNIGKSDLDVFENIFQLGLTTGIFQFESRGMKNILKSIKPNSITELGDLNALYRPGPLQYIGQYKDTKFEGTDIQIFPDEFLQKMEKKFGKKVSYEGVDFFEKIWNEVTVSTKNIFAYQEQLMFFFYLLGHSYTDADAIRKIYSKIRGGKKKFSDLTPYYEKTKKILEEKNIKIEFFDYIYYEILLDWASYGFNKSHSTCYAIIAYIGGWLKYYYPYEFYNSLLRSYENNPEGVSEIVNEMSILDINIKGPDLISSSKHPIYIQE